MRLMRSGSISQLRPSECCLRRNCIYGCTPLKRSTAPNITTITRCVASSAAAMRSCKGPGLILTRCNDLEDEHMTVTEQHFDIIIIGSGAGGGTLAHALASTGKKILILERGGYLRREKANWDSHAVNVEAKYQTREQWRDKNGNPLHPHTNYYVGGNTKFYGAALFRLRREDLCEVRHFGGLSPAWPISYDDLEPYSLQAERLYHVHGRRGEDPTEPLAS